MPCRIIRTRQNPQVKTLETGEIDYDELRAHLVKNKGRPAILNVNIGTTVKGAVDDLDKVREEVVCGALVSFSLHLHPLACLEGRQRAKGKAEDAPPA